MLVRNLHNVFHVERHATLNHLLNRALDHSLNIIWLAGLTNPLNRAFHDVAHIVWHVSLDKVLDWPLNYFLNELVYVHDVLYRLNTLADSFNHSFDRPFDVDRVGSCWRAAALMVVHVRAARLPLVGARRVATLRRLTEACRLSWF